MMIRIDKSLYRHGSFELAIDMRVPRHALVAVLGPSGSGKSTLLNVIAGFEPLAHGSVMLDGKDMTGFPPAGRPVTAVFQDHNSFAHLDAWDNVALGLSPTLSLDGSQRAAVDRALDLVGLKDLARRRPGDMSGGERQRIAVARVLVRKRPILLLDEAFAALGPGLRREMLRLMKALHASEGLTTLMVTHQPEDARSIASSVIFVDGGVVRAPVDTPKFFASGDEAVRRYLGEWT
jgi:thiamine transport system ATP-binding protein